MATCNLWLVPINAHHNRIAQTMAEEKKKCAHNFTSASLSTYASVCLWHSFMTPTMLLLIMMLFWMGSGKTAIRLENHAIF